MSTRTENLSTMNSSMVSWRIGLHKLCRDTFRFIWNQLVNRWRVHVHLYWMFLYPDKTWHFLGYLDKNGNWNWRLTYAGLQKQLSNVRSFEIVIFNYETLVGDRIIGSTGICILRYWNLIKSILLKVVMKFIRSILDVQLK